jgi:hypothetical protein
MTRELFAYGRQNAFSFDLDTRDLRFVREEVPQMSKIAPAGRVSVIHEVEAVLRERLAAITGGEIADRAEDEYAAAELLTDHLQSGRDWEAGQ